MKQLANEYFFLSHAEVDRSLDLHFSEFNLSEVGLKQSNETVSALIGLNIDLVFCSPFKTAVETIQPSIEKSGLRIEVCEEISGRLVGDWPKSETWDLFRHSWSDFSYSQYGAETAQECLQRIGRFIEPPALRTQVKYRSSILVPLGESSSCKLNDIRFFKSVVLPFFGEVHFSISNFSSHR